MGCVSSKVLTKSRSFQEELSLSLQRRSNGVPGLEDLLANKNGGDPLLALLCTANTVAAKLKAGNAAVEQGKSTLCPTEPGQEEKVVTTKTNASDHEATSPETINACDLMAGLDEEEEEGEEQEQEQEQGQGQHGQQQVLRHPQETARSGEVAQGDGEGIVRTRSFRTVEDFDAMVAGNSAHLPLPAAGEEEEQTADGGADKAPEKLDGFKCSDINVQPELSEADPAVWSRSSSRGGSAGAEGNNVAGNRSSGEQKGLRRRAMARELRSLRVPSFEFSSVGSLREWLDGGGQVFSPGSYVTPKFGNFGSPGGGAAKSGDSGCEEALFDPQLVADLEEAMQRLTMEEEHILREIVEGLQGSHEVYPEVDGQT